MADWTGRRILRELSDQELRQRILTTFFRRGDDHARHLAIVTLAGSLRFRPETLRKAPAERKAELLASRLAAADFEETFDNALMVYHTSEAREMLAAFLDQWGIPHVEGSIEVDDYTPPSPEAVDQAVALLRDRFPVRDIAVYLASAGLLMGVSIPEWRVATWPTADRLAAELCPPSPEPLH
ncbi:MAG TPA: hypothetical protein VMS12_04750 [Thermoanaerobaculia bacterium]|nr:hypothetical protein [Thermoanaerobaculia bacterium]